MTFDAPDAPVQLCEPPGTTARAGPSDRQLLRDFVTHHDQRAFRAIVARHGPMVFAVCRRVLKDRHEAEDAFQATFLVLVRKCKAIAKPELLGNWLYGVAYRAALKARARAVNQRANGKQVIDMPAREDTRDVAQQETYAVLDQELNRLPQKYRAPLVLCYLEGKTHEQAAELLGCPLGSMSRHVAKGRELLRARLKRRGVTLSAALLVALLSQGARAGPPAALVESTVHGAVLMASGKVALPDLTTASVAELAEEVLAGMFFTRWKSLVLLLSLVLALGVTGNVASFFATATREEHWVVVERKAAPTPLDTAKQRDAAACR